jgi:DNA-binding MarR family transcriptional regulator
MTKHQSIGRLSSCITHLSNLYITKHLEEYGISSGQIHILMRLYHQDNIHQETLSQDLFLDKTTCTRAIKKLMKEEFITREQDPTDKRAYKIKLTPKAIGLKKEIQHILKNLRGILLKDFTFEENQQFQNFLHRSITNAQNHLKYSE